MRLLKDLREMPGWEKAVLILATISMATWAAGNSWVSPTGKIDLTVVPSDATVLIDNVKVGNGSLKDVRPRGVYVLSVTRDGYARSDREIEIHPGRVTAVNVVLEPSPDTGFELTSEPPGALVWLDGKPVRESSGQQARSNFRASRITPGHHVLELREDRCKPWQVDFEVEAGAIRKIHATLVPEFTH